MVHIRPKGPVPVLALEWQISNEVPNNLAALKKAAELVTPEYIEVSAERGLINFKRAKESPGHDRSLLFGCWKEGVDVRRFCGMELGRKALLAYFEV